VGGYFVVSGYLGGYSSVPLHVHDNGLKHFSNSLV